MPKKSVAKVESPRSREELHEEESSDSSDEAMAAAVEETDTKPSVVAVSNPVTFESLVSSSSLFGQSVA
jgi:hypothetical protein